MTWLQRYRGVSSPVKKLILIEFFLQLINTAYFLVLNYYLNGLGFSDSSIADLIAYRFLVTMLVALPIGFLMRGRQILPFIRIGALCIPMGSFLLLGIADPNRQEVMKIAIGLLGLGSTLVQVLMIPFIMRNEPEDSRMEAIALHFTTWSTTTFLLGTISYTSKYLLDKPLPESEFLYLISILGIVGTILAFTRVQEIKQIPESFSLKQFADYDWSKIVEVMIPGLIIGVGAGLTIPFINLFFLHTFSMPYEDFALLGSISTLFVTSASMYAPQLQARFGSKVAITATQSIAIVALVIMALTALFSSSFLAFAIACFCYLLRQPLMNLANPILSAFTMSYVGDRNREMASALQQSLWAGSWFFSSQIFAAMRGRGYSYTVVLLTTAGIYGAGVFAYYLLIRKGEALTQVAKVPA